jgi:small subunit ribosomal protein S21
VKNTDLTFHQEVTLCSDLYKKEVGTIKQSSYNKYYHPDERSGICVVRRNGESFEELLKRFRKKFSKSGLSKELRDRMYYEKPSDKRRRKKMQSIRLIEREAEKQALAEAKFEKYKRKQKLKGRKENKKHDSSSRR